MSETEPKATRKYKKRGPLDDVFKCIKIKADGTRCGAQKMHGWEKCYFHGGGALPGIKEKGEKRWQAAKELAELELVKLLRPAFSIIGTAFEVNDEGQLKYPTQAFKLAQWIIEKNLERTFEVVLETGVVGLPLHLLDTETITTLQDNLMALKRDGKWTDAPPDNPAKEDDVLDITEEAVATTDSNLT